AFTIFCEERRHPEVSPAVALLGRKPLHPAALDVFARRDPLGTGFVCRVDLFDGLKELGIAGTPPKQLRQLATMFEEAEDMVDYASLVAFAKEQPASRRAASVVSRLRSHLLAVRNGKGLDLRATLEAFAVDDGGRCGRRVLRQPQLEDALQELGFKCTDDEKSALYNRLDLSRGNAGIVCTDLVAFVEGPADYDNGVVDPAIGALTVASRDEERGVGKLLRRAQATIVEAAQRMDCDFEAFDRPYLCYDWRRTGRVGTAEFVRSTVRCGFPFTRAQAAFLAGVFGDGSDVSYPTFLSWATPGPDGLAASGVGGDHRGSGESASRLQRHPEAVALSALEGGRSASRRGGVNDEEEEAELKVRTALQRMGEDGVARAWEEFERMDPRGRRGGVQEEELVEGGVLATLGLPVTATDVAGLMRRFTTGTDPQSKSFFLYPRLLQNIAAGEHGGNMGSGRAGDILGSIRAELRRLVRRTTTASAAGDRGRGGGEGKPATLRAFESFDHDGSGRVSRRDFRRALRELGFNRLGDEEAAEILDRFDPHGDGNIRYEDFLREIEEGEGDHVRRSPSPRGRKAFDSGGTSGRGRLQASLSRAIDRGIDYRREMELEEEGRSGSAVGTGMKEGMVSRQSFRTVMKRIKADLSEGDLADLEKRFAVSSSSSSSIDGGLVGSFSGGRGRAAGNAAAGVRYLELLHWGAPGGDSRGGDDETWAAEERLRQMIRRRFDIWIPGTLKKAFRHFDARRKGKVSETDLSDGLRRLGLELTTRQERGLFRTMDLDTQGFLVYPDLVVFARDPNHHDVRDKVLGRLNRVNESRIRGELERRDPSDSGVISEKALRKVLEDFGVDLAGADLGRLMHRFDVHEDGTASIERVVSFCLLSGNNDDPAGDNRRDSSSRSKGRSGHRGRGHFSNDDSTAVTGVGRYHASPRDSSPAVNATCGGSKGRPKGVTFRDGSNDSHQSRSKNVALLRASLRRLMVSSRDDDVASRGGAGNVIGPGLRDKLRRALQIAADARGARRGSSHVDRETIRRAMVTCGAPLESNLLGDLERRLDRRGTGEINVEDFVEYMAREVENDVWERVAGKMAPTQRGTSSARDGFIWRFISDLGRFVDGREEISRRELRRSLELQGGISKLREEEILVLCDSVDLDRRGRVHLSDVRDALNRGAVVARGYSEEESDSDDPSTDSASTATAVLDGLRSLVHAAERERGVDLLESFEHFDRRGQGEVSKDDFWEGLQSLGLGQDLSRSDVSRVVDQLSSPNLSGQGRKYGYVCYKDFVEAMEGHPPSRGGGGRNGSAGERRKGGKSERRRRRSSASNIERLVDRLKEEIGRLTEEEDGPPPFRQVFEAADHSGLGTLPSLAFRRCLLDGLSLDLTEAECEALLEYLDTEEDNNISYREFLEFVGHEVRERTPPRSRSPRHAARSSASGTAGSRDDFIRSPPRRGQNSSPPGTRRRSRATR
ncbi:unnamed protein product, partial [Ectocarpus sp. 4 AP-2014]